ncbi:TPA: hypothetical protein DCQ44_01780 [Candidatus Taylorbacteria bacterium]|nr:hypothetical protein [Candidatus Taylorbacteria bacterium]
MGKSTTEQQFVKAYDEYLEAIFRFCFYKTNNRDLAKDLAQDTFIRAWKYIQEGNNIENMRALLYKIAGNAVIDWYRKRKGESLENLMEAGFDPVDVNAAADKHSEMQTVLGKLEKLSPDDQQLIVWHYVEGLTSEEISTTLKQNKNTVSVRIHRAVGRLKKFIRQ